MNKKRYWGGLLIILSVFILFALLIQFKGEWFGLLTINHKVLGLLALAIICLILIILYSVGLLGWNQLGKKDSLSENKKKDSRSVRKTDHIKNSYEFIKIKEILFSHSGLFWRRKIHKYLVLGTHSDTELLLPHLNSDRWQISDNTLMLYGGDILDEVNITWHKALKKSFGRLIWLRHKPLDAIIWVLPSDYLAQSRSQQLKLQKSLSQLKARHQAIGWQAPVYLVATQTSKWQQQGRTEQGVGALFTELTLKNINSVDLLLNDLATQCCQQGIEQVITDSRYAFLLQLSQNLASKEINNIKQWLTKWLSLRNLALPRGLFFSPITTVELESRDALYVPEHYLTITPTWQAISHDVSQTSGRRMGIAWETLICSFVLGLAAIMMVGEIVSYSQNRTLISSSDALVKKVNESQTKSYTEQLQAQYALQLQMQQLIYRNQHGSPLYNRFGLNKNEDLLDVLWPHYFNVNDRNIAKPFLTWQNNYLKKLMAMSPNDPNRATIINSVYDVLKSYLMLGKPAKADGQFLEQFVTQNWAKPDNIDSQDWQKLMPQLVRFWGQALSQHPSFAVALDANLVKGTRQLLINNFDVKNAEDTIYNVIIDRVSKNYADQTLSLLLNGLDSRSLFWTDMTVPGVFTRKAWEDVVEDDIDEAAKSRKEQIDWVLSDEDKQVTSSISSEALREQLRERYFSDYSASWLQFLNSLQWRQANNVSDVIEQLTLLSDTRRSPMIALMNTIKYQSEIAYSGDSIGDDLLRTAQELATKRKRAPQLLPDKKEASGPLTATFAPVINLLNNDNSNNLSLQTYLLRVTQVRLKLQNITSSANPQAMTLAFAKSVLQGTSIDLADTRDYGTLVVANLGDEWSGFGHNLFVQPLEQSWQVILTPAAKSFNETWQDTILLNWEKSFAGRYPFKNSDNDASLAELSRFLRPDSGVLDKFITSQLGGVLKKQGDQWVPDPVNSQGLTFNPEFLDALALFGELSTELLANGDAKMAFDLMPRSGAGVLRSELFIDKQNVIYFNQMPAWKRLVWPGDEYTPFAQLSWSTDDTGLRLFGYYAGDWGWIRLLEQAKIKQIDSSRYEVIWVTPQKNELRYILRTQTGSGPINLLQLRNFKLPNQVFVTETKLSNGLDTDWNNG